jgi:hypothetical protein
MNRNQNDTVSYTFCPLSSTTIGNLDRVQSDDHSIDANDHAPTRYHLWDDAFTPLADTRLVSLKGRVVVSRL